jgi:hypothetical protein
MSMRPTPNDMRGMRGSVGFHDSFGVWESVLMEAEEFIEVGDWTLVHLRGRVKGRAVQSWRFG